MTSSALFRYALIAIAAIIAAAAIIGGVTADRLLRIGSGYKAKIACSEFFVAGRAENDVLSTDFAGMPEAMDTVVVRVDPERQLTNAAGPFGLGRARALYRDGYGCTLANGGRIAPLPEPSEEISERAQTKEPAASARPVSSARADAGAIQSAIDNAIANNNPNHRSLMVIVDGQVVAEGYAPGFSAETRMQSWSMAKSVTATLVGAAMHQGLLNIDDPAPVPEWRNDRVRANITWDDLLRMHSGLSFEEEYGIPRSSVNRMLFEAAEAGAIAARESAPDAPGAVWYYSSGATNVIARALKAVLDDANIDFYDFAHETIFTPIAATSFVLEPDASGNFIGSSFAYATTRDWARLGELFLSNGKWNNAQLLPDDWSAYVSSTTPASDGQYGAHFWLNRDGAGDRQRAFPGSPEDVYMMSGHEGQFVFIVPSKNAVIVRTGLTRGRAPKPMVAPLIATILDEISDAPDQRS